MNDLFKRLHAVTPPGYADDVKRCCWLGSSFGVPLEVIENGLTELVEKAERDFNAKATTGGAEI